jgi:predicted GH43/DUF377 family glycosyl hydrolase/pimeloyl-ACP methyl ester carboxylesterase
MRYFHSLIVLFIFYLLFSLPVNAQWTKYSQNPVLLPIQNTWYSQHTASPAVLYEDGIFKMWFQGHTGSTWEIGNAESNNGIQWNVSPQPQITALDDGLGVVDPSVIKNGLIYQMWYHEYTQNESRIRYATSINGISWDMYPQAVLTRMGGGWENTGPTNPTVLFENSEYKMWYVAAGNGIPWKIGYATSLDGITWTRYQNNPLTLPTLGFVGGPSVIKLNEIYHMWYHTGSGQNTDIYHVISTDGINWACDGNCSVLRLGDSFDSQGMTAPTVIKQDSKLYMWYGGSNGSRWQINLATFNLPEEPTPTPSPTPTSTPSPTPTVTLIPTVIPTPTLTPTPYPLTPIIIIPGFMSSWNKDAILHNKSVPQSNWYIPSFVKEYTGLTKTLDNLGWQNNKDYFIFAYDWRRHIEDTASDFNSFLQEKIWNSKSETNISIVGHSLGGLIGRIWLQKYSSEKINHLITVGSPHKGVVQVYKPLEAGEIDRENTFLWLAEKVILAINKTSLESDKKTITKMLPVAQDLFPTFNFLKKESGEEIPIGSMFIKNNLLRSYNQAFSNIFPVFTSIYGEKGNTPNGFTIKPADTINQLLGNYQDGQPIDSSYEAGDYLVLSKSAKEDSDAQKFVFDHGEIITKKEGIKKILDILQINYQDDYISEGKSTSISPSLIFFIKSPATMKVVYESKTFEEQDGIIFIPNAESGNYTLNVKGVDNGTYKVIIGQIAENNDLWETVDGEIIQSPPNSQLDNYSFSYNNQSVQSIWPTPTHTPTPTPTNTPTPTLTPTSTPTPTFTPTPTPTPISSGSSTVQSLQSTDNTAQSVQPTPTSPVYFSSAIPSPQVLGVEKENTNLQEKPASFIKKEQIKNTEKAKILDVIIGPITAIVIAGIGYFLKKKLKSL